MDEALFWLCATVACMAGAGVAFVLAVRAWERFR